MKTVATWIRGVDEALFHAALGFAPELRLVNARTGPCDITTASALLLTGGGDVGPEYLRQEIPDASLIRGMDAARDAWEFAAARAALAAGRPILAICRGHQVLNVVLGGTLRLDIPGHAEPEQRDQEVQPLRLANGVPAARNFVAVNSSHHQAVDRLGDGLVAEAWCRSDDVIEQMSLRDYPWCVGVQFHPERAATYGSLFRSFAAALR